GLLLEGRVSDARHFRFAIEVDARDAEGLAQLFQMYRGGGVHALRREAGAAEARGKSHGETAGVRGGDQLLGIRPAGLLEARGERVLSLERAAAELHPPAALAKTAVPLGF